MLTLEGQRVLVVGLARSGRAAANFLRQRGARVTVTDSRPPWAFKAEMPELIAAKIGVEFGAHREATFLAQDLIVVSPGVPWDMPQLRAARERGVNVIPEVELATAFLPGRLVGITGSNGKTTTTTLLGKMLEASEFPTFVGGNIGVPLISAVDDLSPDSVVVAELSSFQLEAIQNLRPHVAVLLNITPNHLDRHPSFEAYVEAKAQIFRNQTPEDYAVLNADDPTVAGLAPRIKSRQVYFSRRRNLPDGLLAADGRILYRVNNLERGLAATSDVKLRGSFNVENALAAAAAACVLGAEFGAIARAIREFRGVEHRLEYARTVSGVEFYNDSKATSVDATTQALAAFDHGVHLILGGKDKGAPYAPIRELLTGRAREALLIGAAADRIERELAGAVPLVRAGDLETAVRRAFDAAESGDVILLAPACASYDQFESFEQRGRKFKEVAAALAEENRSAAPSSRSSQRERDLRPAVTDPPPASDNSSESSRPFSSGERRAETGISGVTLASGTADVPPSVLNSQSPALAPAAPPRSQHPEPPGLGHRELVYVYEVDAEERAPLNLEVEDEFQEGEFDTRNRVPEGIRDELLIFEVPGSAVRETRSPEGEERGDDPARRKAGQASLF